MPYVKVPRISVIFTYPVSAAGGHFASDDKNGDGEPDGEPGASFHLDFVYVVGKDGAGQDFYQRQKDLCWDPLPGNTLGYPYGVCLDNPQGTVTLLKDAVTGNPVTVLEAGRQTASVPESAVLLLAYDHSSAPVHYYGTTPVSPTRRGCRLIARRASSRRSGRPQRPSCR